MSLSIRWRLTLGIAVALIVTLAAILITLRVGLASYLQSELDDDLRRDAGQVTAQIITSPAGDAQQLQQIVNSYSVGGLASSFTVSLLDARGRFLAGTLGTNAELMALSKDQLQSVLAGRVIHRDVDLGPDGEVRARASRLMVGQDMFIVQVAESTDFIDRPVERLQTLIIAEAIVGVLLAIVIGYILARRAVRPLQDVVDVAAAIQASDLSQRIRASGKPSEVQHLADTFDAMLERLDAAFQQQRNFVLDMSHELRTPLATLRGNIDVLLMDEGLDAATRADLERMSREVARLMRLTTNVLFMAHAEAGRELERRPVDLDVLCLEVYSQAKDLRPEVALRLGHEDQATVIGDRDLLKQLVLNLVDNALKYTPPGGHVALSLFRSEGEARIVVEDTGPGIAARQLPLIFQRMYRAENGARRAAGAGLGLAISDWIARAHGGEITVQSEEGKGSAFTVRLPFRRPDAEPATAAEEAAQQT
jgi:heavy metal sensor kinase